MAIVAGSVTPPSVAKRSTRLRFRFRLRTLLIVTTLLCLALGLLLREAIDYKRRKDGAAALVASLGGTIQRVGWSLEPSNGSNWLSRIVLDVEHQESLWAVDLSGTAVSKADLATLAKCDWIRVLSLANTKTGDADLAPLTRLAKLRQLDISRTAVGDAGLPQLKKLRRLVELKTEGSKVTYAGLAELDRLLPGRYFEDSLAQTQFPRPGISVTAFQTFLGAERLDDEFGMHLRVPDGTTSIHLTNPSAVKPASFEHARHLKSTRSFSASFGRERFAEVGIIASWPELRSLFIDGGQLTDDDFRLIAALPKLKYLTLIGMHNISDGALEQFGENNTLEHLAFSGLRTTVQVTRRLGGLKRLRLLELSLWQKDANGKYEPFVGEHAAEAREALRRLQLLPGLEKLRLRGNVFSDDVMRELANFKKLKQIGYDEKFVGPETVAMLKASLPNCEIKSQGFGDSIDLD
jgi:hypothetical protein